MKKKKRKGFTLVELLAVIVILAVILVIAIPQIMNTIKAARLSSFKDSAILIAEQADKDYLSQQVLNKDYNSTSIPCTDVAKLNDDYASCSISYNNGIATVTLNGKDGGKFSGITCTGTKDNMCCTTEGEESTCNSAGENNQQATSEPGIYPVIKQSVMATIGYERPTNLEVKSTATEAMQGWSSITNDANISVPIYTRFTEGNMTLWCYKNKSSGNCGGHYFSKSDCESDLIRFNESDTYTCDDQVSGNFVNAIYVGFIKDGRTYELKEDKSGNSYNDNKNMLLSVFGTSNCNIDSEGFYIECSDSNVRVYARSDGWFFATTGRYGCRIRDDNLYCSNNV